MPRFSDLTLKNMPAPARGQVTHWDDGSPLGVRVSQGGTKTFIVMLGSGKRHAIGRYGEVTLSQAREAARRLKAEKTLGRQLWLGNLRPQGGNALKPMARSTGHHPCLLGAIAKAFS